MIFHSRLFSIIHALKAQVERDRGRQRHRVRQREKWAWLCISIVKKLLKLLQPAGSTWLAKCSIIVVGLGSVQLAWASRSDLSTWQQLPLGEKERGSKGVRAESLAHLENFSLVLVSK